jgi:tetratricopeptide (TPR) repeat protein
MWLVEVTDELEATKRRYSVHPLTRAFAKERLSRVSEWKEEAEGYVAKFMLNFIEKNKITLEDRKGYSLISLELPNLLSSANWSYDRDYWQMFIDFQIALDLFLAYAGYYDERIRIGLMQINAANKIEDYKLAAECDVWILGWTYYQQDALEDAINKINEGLDYFLRIEDVWWIATTKRILALVLREKGDFAKSEQLLKNALESFEKMTNNSNITSSKQKSRYWWPADYNPSDIPNTLMSLGGVAFRKCDYEIAQDYYEKSMEIFQNIGDEEGIYHTIYHLGMIALQKGEYKKAFQLFQNSLDGSEKVQWIDLEADSKIGIALLKEKTKEFEQALQLAFESMKIYEHLGKQRHIRTTRLLLQRLENKTSIYS